jgi:hypothetical protein
VAVALPTEKKALSSLQGFSRNKVGLYGSALTKIVQDYCTANEVTPPNEADLLAEHPLLTAEQIQAGTEGSSKKIGTREQTLMMQRQGKDIAQIATARSLTESTIKGHIAHYIEKGELKLSDFMSETDSERIRQALVADPEGNLGTARQALNNAFDYGDLKMVQAEQTRETDERATTEATPE